MGLDQIPADRDLARANALKSRAEAMYKKSVGQFEKNQSCLFRKELHATVKNIL